MYMYEHMFNVYVICLSTMSFEVSFDIIENARQRKYFHVQCTVWSALEVCSLGKSHCPNSLEVL